MNTPDARPPIIDVYRESLFATRERVQELELENVKLSLANDVRKTLLDATVKARAKDKAAADEEMEQLRRRVDDAEGRAVTAESLVQVERAKSRFVGERVTTFLEEAAKENEFTYEEEKGVRAIVKAAKSVIDSVINGSP